MSEGEGELEKVSLADFDWQLLASLMDFIFWARRTMWQKEQEQEQSNAPGQNDSQREWKPGLSVGQSFYQTAFIFPWQPGNIFSFFQLQLTLLLVHPQPTHGLLYSKTTIYNTNIVNIYKLLGHVESFSIWTALKYLANSVFPGCLLSSMSIHFEMYKWRENLDKSLKKKAKRKWNIFKKTNNFHHCFQFQFSVFQA